MNEQVTISNGIISAVISASGAEIKSLIKDGREIITKETAKTPNDLYQAGKAFGKFQNRLSDFPSDSLYETIQNIRIPLSCFSCCFGYFYHSPSRILCDEKPIR